MKEPVNGMVEFLGMQADIAKAAYRAAINGGSARREARDIALVVLRAFLETSDEKQREAPKK